MEYLTPIGTILSLLLAAIALYKQLKKDTADISSTLVSDAMTIKEAAQEQTVEIEKRLEDECKKFEKMLDIQKKSMDDQLSVITSSLGKALKDINKLQKRVSYLRKGIDTLISQIITFGETPAWRPNYEEELEE